jgi:transposase
VGSLLSPLPAGRGAGGEDPREQAFALYCRGLRSPAIAARLGVPERTIRRWLQRAQNQLNDRRLHDRKAELLRAIETQRAVIAAAWDAHDRECDIRDALRDAILSGHDDHPYRAAHAARYLAVIVAAQREIARLQGLYDLALDQPDNFHIVITRRPAGPENLPPDEPPLPLLAAYPPDDEDAP